MDYDEFNDERPRTTKKRKFLRKLDTNYLSIKPDDVSKRAQLIRTMASLISEVVTPRQLFTFLFFLAAYTVTFLSLTIIGDVTFIYHEMFDDLSEEASMKLGNVHDAKLRAFGIIFAIIAILVEFDSASVTKRLAVFKSHIPRSLLLLFVSTLCETNPMVTYERQYGSGSRYLYNYDDDYSGYNGYNNAYNNGYNNYNKYNQTSSYSSGSSAILEEMPGFVLRFQTIAASMLQLSVMFYFISGVFCLDQFESGAYVVQNDDRLAPNYLPREMSRSKSLTKQPSSRSRTQKIIEDRSEDSGDNTDDQTDSQLSENYGDYDGEYGRFA